VEEKQAQTGADSTPKRVGKVWRDEYGHYPESLRFSRWDNKRVL